MMTVSMSSELAQSRARIYKTLAIAYALPADEQLLELLAPWGKFQEQLTLGAVPKMMQQGLKKIDAWLEKADSQPSAEPATALQAEFTRLFRGLNRLQSPPPPYESVYVDRGLVYGASTEQVTQRYRRFQLKGQTNEPSDHIALELDFMRFLCQREAQAWQSGKGGQDLLIEQDSFMNEHLMRWIPAFCENIRKFDTIGFYDGLADLTEGWLCYDQGIIKALRKLSGQSRSSRASSNQARCPHDPQISEEG